MADALAGPLHGVQGLAPVVENRVFVKVVEQMRSCQPQPPRGLVNALRHHRAHPMKILLALVLIVLLGIHRPHGFRPRRRTAFQRVGGRAVAPAAPHLVRREVMPLLILVGRRFLGAVAQKLGEGEAANAVDVHLLEQGLKHLGGLPCVLEHANTDEGFPELMASHGPATSVIQSLVGLAQRAVLDHQQCTQIVQRLRGLAGIHPQVQASEVAPASLQAPPV
mmetsp:Transcript_20561/g.52275  ORF Transcript_20561/g.52275 Transcript_20561/m.52275 type:complete len:222 (+) Transcript_20561:361-1026(+)